MSFWDSRLVKSGRKVYRCGSCAREIPAGAASRHECGLVEGHFQSYRLCLPCHDFIARSFERGDLCKCEPFEFDWLPDIARDAGESWPPQEHQQ
jgi:hypothetical protein